ncbi:MAG: 50S ribosomal protein L18 [Dehalococcoidia bacterium]|nr:50S ribosomal protein L18 [Dehalococcoidia bacterium]MEC7809621.1 50S ribosomal protein L18 [Actinomycetota bacterium]
MSIQSDRRSGRLRRHRRIRKSVFGTETRPRLVVFRSSKHISAQLINDEAGETLVSASTQQDGIATGIRGINAATEVGRELANRANEVGVKKVVFDRGGYRYHGRVAALADAARKEGLEF